MSGCGIETVNPELKENDTVQTGQRDSGNELPQFNIDTAIDEVSKIVGLITDVKENEIVNLEVIEKHFFEVHRVVDGDTLILIDEKMLLGAELGEKIYSKNNEVRIRLLMVDTPEVHNVNTPEPFGPEASAFAKKILTNQKVRLEFDKEKLDPYGRTLAYIYLEDGRMFNEMLLEEGLAKVVVFKPNNKYETEFRAIETKAKEEQIGIWSIN